MESVCAERPNWVDRVVSCLLHAGLTSRCLTESLFTVPAFLTAGTSQTKPIGGRLRANKEILMVTPAACWLIFCQGARASYNEAERIVNQGCWCVQHDYAEDVPSVVWFRPGCVGGEVAAEEEAS